MVVVLLLDERNARFEVFRSSLTVKCHAALERETAKCSSLHLAMGEKLKDR